ncbi:helix-turn-helix transcriptional regulator [Shewanella baltica]|uniref:helix-turn-helix transcriptional regulator n=1 Tax=Shewanella baltica TaxID=62322 RepID=UPI00217D3C46|nr:helix-turn-helix transcriptional regulator [Shewanella baltica]MCS6261427.1 helix-turn-helix transcriptional regulator [Shewanella baltica]
MKNLSDLINKISLVSSEMSLNILFSDICELYKYHWGGLIVFTPTSANHHSISAFGNVLPNIVDDIINNKFILNYCMNEEKPVEYSALPSLSRSKPLGNNIELIIPIKGRGTEFACLILSIPDSILHQDLIDMIGWYWLIPSTFIYSNYKKFISRSNVNISQRERECIRWAAEGKTSWEISQILSISRSTVDFHIANCIEKTGSTNRQQAIVKCLFDGQLLSV